ncbi:hypothetical protein Dxin01_00802 [Deinococcus xinjiangensis]|uniref:VWFA domain-containing protein n=1 Tax=Deinococcus xinjiangensis TaxID=457454 RepID=A0ABP9V8P3_9DEIO
MITPRTNKPLPWPQQSAWLKFAGSLFRYYSRRSSYQLVLKNVGAAGAVDPRNRMVYLDPDLLPMTPNSVIRHQPSDEADLRALLMRSILAHEAGHVQFSGDKPSGLLGQLWNALEDERMERLMAQKYPELEAAFDFLGDVLAAQGQGEWDGHSLEGCLAMRWDHDRPTPVWKSADPAQWADIWPLVQAAWQAASSDQVIWIARCILDILKLDQDEQSDPFHGQVQATGAGESREPEPQGESTGPGGGGTGQHPAGPPQRPVEAAAEANLSPVEAAARLLAGVLQVKAAPGRRVSHETRGQLDFERYFTGQRKIFRQHQRPTQPQPLALTWVVDRSGSMDAHGRMGSAVSALRMGLRAAQLAGTPTRVLSFDDDVEEEVAWHTPFQRAEQRVQHLTPRGLTYLAPALQEAFTGLQGKPGLHLVVVISDGGLDENDLHRCAALLKTAPAPVLPVLIGEAAEPAVLARWQSVFRPVLVARDHTQLAGVIKSRLQQFRLHAGRLL